MENFAYFSNISLYYLIAQERYSYSNFDRQFLKDFGYDQRLHRDDREHFKARGLHVNDEVCFTVSSRHISALRDPSATTDTVFKFYKPVSKPSQTHEWASRQDVCDVIESQQGGHRLKIHARGSCNV